MRILVYFYPDVTVCLLSFPGGNHARFLAVCLERNRSPVFPSHAISFDALPRYYAELQSAGNKSVERGERRWMLQSRERRDTKIMTVAFHLPLQCSLFLSREKRGSSLSLLVSGGPPTLTVMSVTESLPRVRAPSQQHPSSDRSTIKKRGRFRLNWSRRGIKIKRA